jgi:hypothetical protein
MVENVALVVALKGLQKVLFHVVTIHGDKGCSKIFPLCEILQDFFLPVTNWNL